jgi:hypothetical protein
VYKPESPDLMIKSGSVLIVFSVGNFTALSVVEYIASKNRFTHE